ncbi:MAG TPA: ROK family protein [Terriglobia bacterium]|nr:ROK family protein [Terriglobia bacterium]
MWHTVLAVDIGGTHFRLGLFDHQGRRLVISEGDTLRSGGREWMLEQIRQRTCTLLEQSDSPVGACGISFGGPVDFQHQRVTSVHSPGWKNFSFAEWVGANLHLPCLIDNDANAGALGEFRYGAGRGTNSMVYVTLSTGIGAGLILNGKTYRGKDGLAGELGHVPISGSGIACSCGAVGCLESFSSGWAIAERGKEWGRRRRESLNHIGNSSGESTEGITAKEVVLAASEGDTGALQIVQEAARWLARGLLTVIRILNPDRIILGGGLTLAGRVLLDPLHQCLKELASPTIGYSTEIVTAELGLYSPLHGAAAMALDLMSR